MSALEADALVDALTLDEQVSLLSGSEFWALPAIERLGLGRLHVTDGPNGARGGGSLLGGIKAAAFPVGISLGASWDAALLREIGGALAREARDKGAHVLLAPTVNLHRGALNGRNFECYSEDPILTARLAAAYIAGLQGNGVGATIKHFVGNESEIKRTTMSSQIDERTLRELYLVPFETAVKQAGTWAVMSSYNRLNGAYTSEHRWLLTDVLRGDWGFSGAVISDWFGSHSTAETVNAGLDIEMPGPTRHRGAALVAAVQAGAVPAEAVRRAARNVLRLMQRTGALTDTAPHVEHAIERDETRALIRRAGAAGAVLLKNDGVLPMAAGASIAVIGPNARVGRCMGGGSAYLNAHRQVSPWEGLVAALGERALSFAPGCTNHRFEPALQGPLHAEWFDNPGFRGEPVYVEERGEAVAFLIGELAAGRVDPRSFSLRMTGRFTPEMSGVHRVGVHCAGRARVFVDGRPAVAAWEDWERGTTFFEEGCDERVGEVVLEVGKPAEVVIEFSAAPSYALRFSAFHIGIGRPLGDAEFAEAVRIAADADIAILCIGRNDEWDSEGADLPSMTLPGRQDELAAAVAAVTRKTVVVLQTGGPVEMPWADDVAAILQAWYPGQEAGHSIADVLLGIAEPGGRLPQSFPARLADTPTQGNGAAVYPGENGRVHYDEGLFIGYRHHARAGVPALFGFGHGLGYADIDIRDVSVDDATFDAEGTTRVRVTLANTGRRAGGQVVQLYVAPLNAPVERPEAELKAFAKVALEPGDIREVELELGPRDFAWYSTERRGWVVSPGAYELRTGVSAADRRFAKRVVVTTEMLLPP